MNQAFGVPELAENVRQGIPGAADQLLAELQPHMERMMRRAMRGRDVSALSQRLRQAALSADSIAAAAKTVCHGVVARLSDANSLEEGTQLAGSWWAGTALA